jgi:hypothetical protein
MKTARFLGEMLKFGLARPAAVFGCLQASV